jgi:hypothetical protein
MKESQEYLKSNPDLSSTYDDNDISSDHILVNTDPITKSLKIFFLIIICLTGIGSYFCYDNPGALEKQIIDVKNI